MPQKIERRKQRSTDPIIALHHQLAAVKTSAELDAVVLVDDTGCLVAGAGAWPVCEELAAFAPFLADGAAACSEYVATQTAILAPQTHVRPLSIDGMDVVLCAKGANGRDVSSEMTRAATGCHRILAIGP